MMTTTIKIILAVLLFIAMARLPYGYYQFVRLAAFVAFIYLAYTEFKHNRQIIGIVCVAGAILFNPVFKIAFGRELWHIVDMIAGVLLVIWAFTDWKKTKS